jgi:hypothetical protein
MILLCQIYGHAGQDFLQSEGLLHNYLGILVGLRKGARETANLPAKLPTAVRGFRISWATVWRVRATIFAFRSMEGGR